MITTTTAVLCLVACQQPEAPKVDPHAEVQAKLVALQAEGQPDGPNAYDTLLELKSAIEKLDDKKAGDDSVKLHALLHPQGAVPADIERARRVFEKVKASGIERLIIKASDCPRLVRPLSTGLVIDNMAPDLVPIRNALSIELLLAKEDLAASNFDAWLGRMDRSLRLARLVLADYQLIGYVVGSVVSQRTLEEAALAVDSGKLSADALRRLRKIIRQYGPVLHTTKCLEGERLMSRDAIEWVYERDSQKRFAHVTGGPLPPDDDAAPSEDPPLAGWAPRAEVLVMVDHVYDDFKRICAQPCFQWHDFDFRDAYDQNGRYAIIAATLAAVMKDYLSADQADLEFHGLDSMIALELYRVEHHRYPDSFDDLIPALLPEVPTDPFSGAKLQYGPAPSGKLFPGSRPYVLYALGRDGKDDNGHVDPDHPWAATAYDVTGFDILLNPARSAK